MRPGLSFYDALDAKGTDRIAFGEAVTGFSLGVSGSDCPHLILCEDGLRAISASTVLPVPSKNPFEDAGSMNEVFTTSDDLKVFQPVIVFDPVDVVNHHIFRNSTDKKLVNKSMDFKRSNAWSSRPQGNDIVAVFVYTASNDLPSSSHYSTSIGDLIPFPFREVCPGFVFHNETIQ